jgi:ribosomal protein S18 acetylase RimI-like enzyme
MLAGRNRMASTILVRMAALRDAPHLVSFNMAMAHETEELALDEATVLAGVRGLFERPEYGFYLVAEIGGEVVGGLMVTPEWSDWRNGVFWWVQSVYVRPERRGQGVYRALYDEVRRLAREHGEVCGIRLYVEKDNRRAQAVYRRLGMSETHYRLFEAPFDPSGGGAHE